MRLFDFLFEIPQTTIRRAGCGGKPERTRLPCADSDHADISSSFSRLLYRRASMPLGR